jgi:hypothetical protein
MTKPPSTPTRTSRNEAGLDHRGVGFRGQIVDEDAGRDPIPHGL